MWSLFFTTSMSPENPNTCCTCAGETPVLVTEAAGFNKKRRADYYRMKGISDLCNEDKTAFHI